MVERVAETMLDCLEDLARRAADPVGVDIAWVELNRGNNMCYFRVFIDRESGVGLADCERVNERLGVLLDVEDPIEFRYTLEVSTPGLDRPLWTKRDYERFVGNLARVKTREPLGERSRFHGRLAGVDGENILMEEGGAERRIPFSAIENGRLEVEMFRPHQPTKTRKRHSRQQTKRRS